MKGQNSVRRILFKQHTKQVRLGKNMSKVKKLSKNVHITQKLTQEVSFLAPKMQHRIEGTISN